jgi:phenylpropionate dioxygenase-like ring-hydroxylating dioxygenase large terminal subunit
MFLRNAWYVARWSSEVTHALSSVQILAQRIVIFRKPDGSPVALEDACPHRKLPLSRGRLKGDLIECGYHGLTLDASGQCVRIPSQSVIPPGACVRAYPLVEKWQLLWIWMGRPELADPSAIPFVEHYDDPAWAINRGEAMELDCHYLLMTDNLLDPTHVAFVHSDTFGEASCADTPLETEKTDRGVTVSRWMKDVPVAPFYASLMRFEGLADRQQHYEVHYPCNAIIRAIYTSAGTGGDAACLPENAFIMNSYNFMTPIDENRTRYFWFQVRNVAAGREDVSREMTQSVRKAFEEDRQILAAVHEGTKSAGTAHIDLGLDRGPLMFRRRLAQLIAEEGSEVNGSARHG